jgi:hypothetical protein
MLLDRNLHALFQVSGAILMILLIGICPNIWVRVLELGFLAAPAFFLACLAEEEYE